jgi:O-antigen/teichoic acid export membrane protein
MYALAHLAWVPSQVLILALIATGRHGPVGLALLADSVVNVILSVVLVLTIGPIGVAISTLVLLAIVHVGVIPAIASRRLVIPPLTLARSLGVGAVTGMVVVAVIGLLPDSGPPWLVVRAVTAIAAIVAILAVDQRVGALRRLVALPP